MENRISTFEKIWKIQWTKKKPGVVPINENRSETSFMIIHLQIIMMRAVEGKIKLF